MLMDVNGCWWMLMDVGLWWLSTLRHGSCYQPLAISYYVTIPWRPSVLLEPQAEKKYLEMEYPLYSAKWGSTEKPGFAVNVRWVPVVRGVSLFQPEIFPSHLPLCCRWDRTKHLLQRISHVDTRRDQDARSCMATQSHMSHQQAILKMEKPLSPSPFILVYVLVYRYTLGMIHQRPHIDRTHGSRHLNWSRHGLGPARSHNGQGPETLQISLPGLVGQISQEPLDYTKPGIEVAALKARQHHCHTGGLLSFKQEMKPHVAICHHHHRNVWSIQERHNSYVQRVR